MEQLFDKSCVEIIVVDDKQGNLKILGDILSVEGYLVRPFTMAKNALESTKEKKPNLFLLDVNMPEMNGFELCNILKDDKVLKDVPVIFLSGAMDIDNKVEGFKIGAVDFITKPLQSDEVLARVDTHLKNWFFQEKLKNVNIMLEEKVEERTAELRQTNDELKVAKEKAEKSDRLKTEFLAQMSHEIRTPLSAIMNSSLVIKEELVDKIDEDYLDFFDIVDSAGSRLIRTVDLILNVSELHAGVYESINKDIDIYADILEKLYTELSMEAESKNLKIVLKKNTDDTVLLTDEYSVYQTFSNLIDNAIKYTNEGKVEIVVSRNENNKLTVKVTDTGIGISEDYIPILFDAFSQEEQGYTRRFEGNGLGLTLAKKYCDINDAQIIVNSKKSKGTTFTVIFNS
jgi:signal transduction histidine kinase